MLTPQSQTGRLFASRILVPSVCKDIGAERGIVRVRLTGQKSGFSRLAISLRVKQGEPVPTRQTLF